MWPKDNNYIFFAVQVGYLEGAGGGTVGPIIQGNITKNTFEFGNFLKIIIPFSVCGQKGNCTVFIHKNSLSFF